MQWSNIYQHPTESQRNFLHDHKAFNFLQIYYANKCYIFITQFQNDHVTNICVCHVVITEYNELGTSVSFVKIGQGVKS
jgi:hypothetical protein